MRQASFLTLLKWYFLQTLGDIFIPKNRYKESVLTYQYRDKSVVRLRYSFLFCFVFVTSYLYSGVYFHKCILNKCVDVWKRDLLNSWKREFYIHKCFYKRCFRKYSRAVAVAFVFYSQCLPCCVLCETTEHARICDFVVGTVLL